MLFLFLSITGCTSSDSGKKSELTRTDTTTAMAETTKKVPEKPKTTQPTTIKPNGTVVVIKMDSLALSDEFHYRFYGTIFTAIPERGMESFAEANQKVELTPEYILNDSGKVAVDDMRNQTILQLRNAKPGDSFMGSISLHTPGGWVITRVDNLMSTH